MRLLFRLIFLFSLVFSQSLFAQGIHPAFDIQKIPSKILDPIVKAHPNLFNDLPSPSEMDKILEYLYGTGEFETLRISEENGRIILAGTPLKIIASISVQGNSKLSDSAVLGAFNMSQGEKFIFQNVYDGAERIKELYGKNGFFNAVVSIDTQPASNNRLHLQLIIEENKPCLVKRIDFNSSYGDLSSQIQRRVRRFLNRPLTDDLIIDIEAAVKDFFIDNKILSVSIQGPIFQYNKNKTEVYITYTLENAYRYMLFFEGNQFFHSVELSHKLEIGTKLQFGSNPIAEIASKLERIYQQAGFAHVSVKYRESVRPKSFTRRAYFKINEGPRSFLRIVNFNGKLSRPQRYYLGLFRKFYNSRVYNTEAVKSAQENLVIALQNQGFLRAQVLSSQTTFSNDKRRAELSLFIDEGPQTIINSIQFEGIQAFSKHQLLGVIGLREQTPINLAAVEASIQKIVNFYHSHGYLEMEMKSTMSELVKYSDDYTQADLFFRIYEGPQIQVSKIVIEGNTITKPYVILNELEFDEGEVLTPQKINDSEYHLQKTGLFTQVDISTLEKGTDDPQRTVLIRVAERDPGLFNLGFGVNTEFELTVRGYAGLSYGNLAGTARALSARVELSRVADINFIDHTVTLGYLEPTLFAKRTRGRINLIRTREIISRDPEVEVLESNRVNFLVEKDFTRYLKLTWVAWSISTNKQYELESQDIIEDVNIAAIGPIIEYDKRDHPFVTRKGYYTKLSSEFSDPSFGSSDTVHYFRNVAQINTYVPMKLRSMVWATSLAGGYLINTQDNDNTSVPDVKIFKLGGRDTIRGFDPNEIPGRDINNVDPKVMSDSHYYLVKSEFRVPIVNQIESVFFYDGGAVFIRDHEFADPYRDAAGIGFRYQTPVGPLSVEYGHRLDRNRDLDEPSGRFHLSFGTF